VIYVKRYISLSKHRKFIKKTDLHHDFHTKKLASHFQIAQSTYHHLPVF